MTRTTQEKKDKFLIVRVPNALKDKLLKMAKSKGFSILSEFIRDELGKL